MEYFLPSFGLFVVSSLVLWFFGRQWSEQTWLWLNFVWLLTAFFSVTSVIPLAKEISRGFDIRFAERQVIAWEKNGLIGLTYIDWVDSVKPSNTISYFGPAEFANDQKLQGLLRVKHEERYKQAQEFKRWAKKLNKHLIDNVSNERIFLLIDEFKPTDRYVVQIYRWTRENVAMFLEARHAHTELFEFIYSKNLKRFTIFCFAILFPIALGIPVARNVIDIKETSFAALSNKGIQPTDGGPADYWS
jgi:hypothetical protein